MQLNKNQQSYFDAYPQVDAFHFTSDGMAFFTPAAAASHAASLPDRTVTTATRIFSPITSTPDTGGQEQETLEPHTETLEAPAKPAVKKGKK